MRAELREPGRVRDVGLAPRDCPHQGLDDTLPVTPDQRFAPVPPEDRAVIDLWLPPTMEVAAAAAGETTDPPPGQPVQPKQVGRPAPVTTEQAPAWAGGPVEFDRVVPPSGNMIVCQRQFWMGTHLAGMTARIWADCDLIHVLIAGTRNKTVRSHLSVNDLAKLLAHGAQPGGPSPLPPVEDSDAIEVERCVTPLGMVSLGGRHVLAAEILGGRRVGIRIEPAVLMVYDLESRELLRTRKNPLTPNQVKGLKGQRPAGPPPRPSDEPVRVQRRVSTTGVITVCGQQVALGRTHQDQTVTVLVSESTLAVELGDGDTKIVRRTTTTRSVTSRQTGRGRSHQFPRPHVADQLAQIRRRAAGTSHRAGWEELADRIGPGHD